MSAAPSPLWHASPALLFAYAGGRCGPADAWSLEMHLPACPLCRAELALALSGEDVELLDKSRQRVLSTAAPLRATSRGARLRVMSSRWRVVLSPAAAVATTLAVAAALVVNLALSGDGSGLLSGLGASGQGGWPLALLAPALPLVGVASCSTTAGDPCREAVLATGSAGVRLVLVRTLAVLAIAVPLTVVSGWLLGAPGAALWLLPALTLTGMALALGTRIGLERAAAVVAGSWLLVALGPALVSSATPGALGATVASLSVGSRLLSPGAQGWWALALGAALAVVALRRGCYERLSTAWGAPS